MGKWGGWEVKKYRVRLEGEEQEELKALVSRGRAAAYKQIHARILLLSDENQAAGPMQDQEIARALKVGTATVERVRRRCVEEGVEAALGRREQLNRRKKKLDGAGEGPTGCPGLLEATGGTGKLDPADAGRRTGGKGDSGQHRYRYGASDAEKKTNSSPG